MALNESRGLHSSYSVVAIKSFLLWSFTLTVCFLVIGFPVVILMVTIGALLAVVLQAVIPMSAVLLIAGGLLGVNVLLIMMIAGVLTLRGIHPAEVSWLKWLRGEADPLHTSVYAACPLTCDLHK